MTKSPRTLRKFIRSLCLMLAVAVCTGTVIAAGPGDMNQIQDVNVVHKGNQTIVTVVGSVRPMYTAFKLSSPQRLVVDLANSRLMGAPRVLEKSTRLVDGVAVSEFTTGKVPVSRVMINFRQEASYRVRVDDNKLVITLSGGPAKSAQKNSNIEQEEQVISLASVEARVDEVKNEANAKLLRVKEEADNRVQKAQTEAETRIEQERYKAKTSIQKAQSEAEAKVAQERSLADARIRKAREEAKKQVIQARESTKEAQDSWRKANLEMNKLKATQKIYEERLQKAQDEAQKAREELRALNSGKNSATKEAVQIAKRLSAVEKSAQTEINKLKNEIEIANKAVEKERQERLSLQKELEKMNGLLAVAQEDAKKANVARNTAQREADRLKEDVSKAFFERQRAQKEARAAAEAQRKAEEAYKRASEEEKRALHEAVVARQKETVAARQKYVIAEEEHKKIDGQLEDAQKQLHSARRQSEAADKERQRAENLLSIKTKEYEDRLAQLQGEINTARQAATKAELSKQEANAKLEEARKNAQNEVKKQERASSAQIKAAEQRVAKAEQEAKKVKSQSDRVVSQIEKLESELKSANLVISKQKEQIALLEKSIEEQKRQLAQNKAQEAENSRALKENFAKAEQVSQITSGSSGKLTQEEIRKQRLAQLRGETAKENSKPSQNLDKIKNKTASNSTTKQVDKPSDNAIWDIRFANSGNTQKVLITGDGELVFNKSSKNSRTMVLELSDVRLLPMLERTLDVSEFGGSLSKVSSYVQNDKVLVEVELATLVKDNVVIKDGVLEWSFTGNADAPKEITPLGPNTRVVHRERANAYEYPGERTAAFSANIGDVEQKPRRYTGRRIDLDFKSADIHNILRLLADVGHVNIITSSDVSGQVTIRMRDVPWDQALDVILQTKGLGQIRQGNLIRVAPLAVLESEYEKAIERMKMSKELRPLETRLIPISYATARELKPRADDLLTDRGKLSVDDRTNVIIARDVPEILDQIEVLIRNLDTQTPQVLIEGRIVEATSTYAREIGIQWGGDFSASAATGNPTGLAFPSSVGLAGGATDNQTPIAGMSPVAGGQPNPNFAVNLPAAVGTGSGGALGISLGSISNNANLNLRLSAMEEEGTLRILSSPKILTLDNREAHIEQGTMIPYSRISAQGIQTSFQEAKLNLTVTPHVTADSSILLSISMTRDEPDFNNRGARGDPTILKREAQTELLVNDGHTAVIGGIYTRNHGRSYKKVPFFGNIPILGVLFRSRSDSDRRSEMLIFITPTIVNRAQSIGRNS